jgi:hypothetical protein
VHTTSGCLRPPGLWRLPGRGVSQNPLHCPWVSPQSALFRQQCRGWILPPSLNVRKQTCHATLQAAKSSSLRLQAVEVMVVACSAMFLFMYLRAILCTFQISVDFYYVPVGGRGGGRGGLEWVGARGRGIECILYRYS